MIWESGGTGPDRREVTLGCRGTVLLEKVGRVSPDMGLKPGKVNSLEDQRKTNKENRN